MTAWLILNALFRIGILLIVVYKLTVFHDAFNQIERFGLGLAGGSALLTIPAIWRVPGNPFDHWATATFSFGILLYIGGRLVRLIKHRRNNLAMIRQAHASKR